MPTAPSGTYALVSPFAGPAKPRHDFVGNHQDAVFRAQVPHALEITVGRDQDAIRSGHRLHEKGGDRLWPLELNDFLEIRKHLADIFPPSLDPVVRVEHMHDAGHPGLGGPPTRISGQHDAASRSAVIRTVASKDFVTAGV